jgi:hypothetical protein
MTEKCKVLDQTAYSATCKSGKNTLKKGFKESVRLIAKKAKIKP